MDMLNEIILTDVHGLVLSPIQESHCLPNSWERFFEKILLCCTNQWLNNIQIKQKIKAIKLRLFGFREYVKNMIN